MIKNIIPINRTNTFPVVEFAENLEVGKIAISEGTDGKSKLLTLSMINNLNCKVGECVNEKDITPIFGLLFYQDESIDIVIKHLKKLKKIKLNKEE